ncbi:histone-lysine N-methyltransferase SETMAR [Trichonephila clavipes]|nr:histone-lysine N-methyltransferase SETMAR [Trichonephila clavipes]
MACLVTSSSPVQQKIRRVGKRCTLNLSRAETSTRWSGSCPALVFENVDKIVEIIEVYRHVGCRSLSQELKIDHETVLSHLSKVGFKKKLHVWARQQLTPKNMMNRISICESLAKRNEVDPFLKWMVTGYEKWVTDNSIVRKRSWSKCGEAAQTVIKPGLTSRKVLLCIWWNRKRILYYELLP